MTIKKEEQNKKINTTLYADPIVFMPLTVNTSGLLYDDFLVISCLTESTHREVCFVVRELEESDQFRFLHSPCLTHLKVSVCLI